MALAESTQAVEPQKGASSLLRWSVFVVITAALLWLFVRKIDPSELLRALKGAVWGPVVAAALIAFFVCIGASVERLRALMGRVPASGPEPALGEMFSIYLASCAAHNLLPAPAGEVVRSVHLYRRHGYAAGSLVAVMLVEKVIESLGLGLLTLLAALAGGSVVPLPRGVGIGLYTFALLGGGGALVVMVVGSLSSATAGESPGAGPHASLWARGLAEARGLMGRVADGMRLLRSRSTWLKALGWSLLNDVANAATVGLCCHALGVPVPITAWFLVILLARLAGLLPSTPGQFGVQEAGIVVALAWVGVDQSRGLAIALLYRLVHFVPSTVAGLWELRRLWVSPAVARSS
jgi:uncharacterized membrane protein YbhN (UPF0104 family)